MTKRYSYYIYNYLIILLLSISVSGCSRYQGNSDGMELDYHTIMCPLLLHTDELVDSFALWQLSIPGNASYVDSNNILDYVSEKNILDILPLYIYAEKKNFRNSSNAKRFFETFSRDAEIHDSKVIWDALSGDKYALQTIIADSLINRAALQSLYMIISSRVNHDPAFTKKASLLLLPDWKRNSKFLTAAINTLDSNENPTDVETKRMSATLKNCIDEIFCYED